MSDDKENFYAITREGKIREYISLEIAYATNSKFVLCEKVLKREFMGWINIYLECELYDGITKESTIEFHNWIISDIQTKMNGYWKTTATLRIVDPLGEVKTKEFMNFHSDKNSLFNYLISLDNFCSWKEIEMHEEIQLLKIETQRLTEELGRQAQSNKNEIQRLEDELKAQKELNKKKRSSPKKKKA